MPLSASLSRATTKRALTSWLGAAAFCHPLDHICNAFTSLRSVTKISTVKPFIIIPPTDIYKV